jgi:hypothetical protein
VEDLLRKERDLQLDSIGPYTEFASRVANSRRDLRKFVGDARLNGKRISALGASTKGNVLLQYCGFTEKDIQCVGEVNVDKFGCVTPGSWIPILPESAMLALNPDFLLVLPWHFRKFFVHNESLAKWPLILPLPKLQVLPPRI